MKKRIFAVCLIGIIAATAALGGCGETKNTDETTTASVSSQAEVTSSADGTQQAETAGKETDTATNEATQSANNDTPVETKAPAEETTKAESSEGNGNSSDSQDTPEDGWNGNPDNNGSFEPQGSVSTNEKECTITVAGKTYKANKGDIVTYKYFLKTPSEVECFQGTTSYDPQMLKFVKTTAKNMFPVSGGSTVANYALTGSIPFNAVDLEGFDFTKGGVLVCFEFEVLSGGKTSVGSSLEYLDGIAANGTTVSYIDSFKVVGDISFSEELSK